MWRLANANSSIECDSCQHLIIKSDICLTEFPELAVDESPDAESAEFRHFHVACRNCTDERSCFEIYAAGNAAIVNGDDIGCSHCDHTINAGQQLRWDYYFASELVSESAPSQEVSYEFTGLLRRITWRTSFQDLGLKMQRKITNAGLNRNGGIRTPAEATEFYKTSIPSPVRALGEGAVREFTDGKQASHIESVKNSPGKVKSAANIVWEFKGLNMARGSRNMSRFERASAGFKNNASSAKIIAKNAAVNARRAAGVAILIETSVSLVENTIYLTKGKKSKRQATKDTVTNVGKAGIIGGVVAVGVTAATAAGAGPVMASVAPVVGVAGMGILGVSSYKRIRQALQDPDLEGVTGRVASMDTLPLFFHDACPECQSDISCFESFAAEFSEVHSG